MLKVLKKKSVFQHSNQNRDMGVNYVDAATSTGHGVGGGEKG